MKTKDFFDAKAENYAANRATGFLKKHIDKEKNCVLELLDIKEGEHILDAGCGEGIFATIAAQKFSKLSGKKIEKVIEDNIYFTDISEKYIKKTKQNLQKLSKIKIKKYNAIADDFCFHKFDEKFDFIIGNPPYVRIQNLNDRREQLQKKYITASTLSS